MDQLIFHAVLAVIFGITVLLYIIMNWFDSGRPA